MLQPTSVVSDTDLGRGLEGNLGDKGHKLSEMVGLFVGIYAENLADAGVMVPLLQELLFISDRIALDEILKLGKI